MSTVEYDITSYQPILYAAESMDQLEDVVGGFFATADDDTPARLKGGLRRPEAAVSPHPLADALVELGLRLGDGQPGRVAVVAVDLGG